MTGAIPPDGTKQSHASQREQFKTVSLGVLYGLSGDGLAGKLGLPAAYGHDLLRMHKDVFRRFWQWSALVQDQGMLAGKLSTVFGWCAHAGREANARSLRNFPMQGNGAEMLRVACCLATEAGITVCCPVHDALLIEADADAIEAAVARTQEIMRQASEVVLAGFSLRTNAKAVRHPGRYRDPRGEVMWRTVMELCGRCRDA
jgi:DNA polymerase I-like protein with 3'-5' exonuclease and polymerase domains